MSLNALRVRGPFKGPSGYDHHVREFVRELHRQGVAVELVDMPEWGSAKLPWHLRDEWFESLDKPTETRIVLHFCMPHQVVPAESLLNVNYTMFEADRIPRLWADHSRSHDLIILPTESSKRAWTKGGVPEHRIRLCPLGVDGRRFSGTALPLPLTRQPEGPIDQYRVRLLNVSELGPRKNIIGLLRAWLRATTPRDDAVLLIKPGFYVAGWLEQFQRQIELLQQHVRKRLDEAAPVHFIYDLFSDEDMPRLYAAATHYISMSLGEGWDQPMMEAAASGLRLIAPDHSAYRSYLDRSVAQLIPSQEVAAVFPGGGEIGSLFTNARWWKPDEDVAIAQIRTAIDGTDRPMASARERVLSEFSWERATSRLIDILAGAKPRRAERRFWLLPQLNRHP